MKTKKVMDALSVVRNLLYVFCFLLKQTKQVRQRLKTHIKSSHSSNLAYSRQLLMTDLSYWVLLHTNLESMNKPARNIASKIIFYIHKRNNLTSYI